MRDVLAAATATLRAAGVPAARVDAELLLAHVLGIARGRLPLVDRVPVPDAARFAELLQRRRAREPLQHLLGTAVFRHVTVAVGPGVFVPRPETELLVDAVLPLLPGAVVVDLCAGSGALALAIADEVPGARVLAVERSPDALAWLRRNTAGTRVEAVPGDVTDPDLSAAMPLAQLRGRVDAVVSNPPYVPQTTPVGAEVDHDPAEAVFAGPDGLALMPAVLAVAAVLLRPGGRLAVEHDDTHEVALPELLRADGRFTDVRDHRDLTGRPRYATARRAGDES